jgi:hypothetical protein
MTPTDSRTVLSTILAAVLGIAAFTVPTAAHQGHEHKVLGTVQAVTTDSVTVVDSKGAKHSGEIVEGTTVVERPTGKVTATDIVLGERCALVMRMEGEKMIALKIQLGAKPAVKP